MLEIRLVSAAYSDMLFCIYYATIPELNGQLIRYIDMQQH